MKAVGLIVEYNPFHNGHLYHLKKAKELSNADVTIAVMPSYFVQRGEPAMVNKELRVKEALKQGVDLIVELPFVYAVNNADIFAFGALSILEDLMCESFCFGSETGDTKEFLTKYEQKGFFSPRLDEVIRDYLDLGFSYPAAKSKALYDIHEFYLETPNDILGYAYINCLEKYGYKIKPLIYKRENNESINEVDEFKYPSAKAIRNKLKNNESINEFTPMIIESSDIHFYEQYFEILKYILVSKDPSDLAKIHLVDEGIEHLLIKKIKESKNMEEFISKCTSKRYSGARIKRTIIHILNNTKKDEILEIIKNKPNYIRVLGFNKTGATYLASIRKDVTTPILNRFEGKEHPLLKYELKASDVYNSVLKEPIRSNEQEKELFMYPIRNF